MRIHPLLVGVLILLVGTACGLFEVSSPLQVSADSLKNPALAPVLVRSAIADFECAFGNYAAFSAIVTDEFYGSATAANSGYDLRQRGTGIGETAGCATVRSVPTVTTFVPLQTARYQADDTYVRLQNWDSDSIAPPGKTVFMATMAVYTGYLFTLFGEGYCQSTFDLGPPLQPREVLDSAVQWFTTALQLAQQAGNTELVNFAHAGRARALLAHGSLAAAAADAQLVPPGYVRYATFSSESPRRSNQIYMWNNYLQWASVDTSFRNLKVAGVPDPRVTVKDALRNGVDNRTRLWLQTKYPSEGSPIPIASWEEAQLIIAEAEGGQSAVNHINAVRGPGLPAFASTDSAAIARQVAEERRRQLFLDGHRLGDLLRDSIPDNLQFPRGTSNKGQPYGDMTCHPLPRVETDNNPHFPH